MASSLATRIVANVPSDDAHEERTGGGDDVPIDGGDHIYNRKKANAADATARASRTPPQPPRIQPRPLSVVVVGRTSLGQYETAAMTARTAADEEPDVGPVVFGVDESVIDSEQGVHDLAALFASR